MFGKEKKPELPEIKKTFTKIDAIKLIKKAIEDEGMEFDYAGEDDMGIFRLNIMGDDLPIQMNIIVGDCTIRYKCNLDITTKKENYEKVAWQLNIINMRVTFGAFYLDPDDGMISFLYNFPYAKANLDSEFILAFIKMIGDTVDTYDGELKCIAE